MDKNKKELTIFTMSDATGQTAEAVALAAIRQFRPSETKIIQEVLPRIVNTQQITQIMGALDAYRPCMVAYTLVIPEFKDQLQKDALKFDIPSVDIINPMIDTISNLVNKKPRLESGLNQALDERYFQRIEAIEFAIKFDDGKDPRGILNADIVLIGVSRTSKTPTCMYLAQNRGIKAGNIPIVPGVTPPKELFEISPDKVIGLIIDPEILLEIRTSRLYSLGLTSSSDYANYEKIISELEYAESIMRRIRCPVVDVSRKAIEETASDILMLFGKNKLLK